MDEREYSPAPHRGLKDNVSNTPWKENKQNGKGTWRGGAAVSTASRQVHACALCISLDKRHWKGNRKVPI